MWFENLQLRAKILLIVAAAFLGMALLIGLALSSLNTELLAGRRIKVQQMVEAAYGIVAHYEGQVRAGRLSEAEAKLAALDVVRSMRYGDNDYFWINDMTPTMVMHPIKPELDGQNIGDMKTPSGAFLFRDMIAIVKNGGADFYFYLWPKPNHQDPVRKLSYVKGFAPWGWIIGTGIYLDDLEASFREKMVVFGTMGAAVMLMVSGLSLLIARRISRPMGEIVNVMGRLANDELSVTVPFQRRADEIGAIAKALGVFKDAALRIQTMAAERLELERRNEIEKKNALRSLGADIGQVVGVALSTADRAVMAIRSQAAELAQNAEAATRKTAEVATQSERANGSVASVGTAAERLVHSIREINADIAGSSQVAKDAVHEAEKANTTVAMLSQASDRISDVLSLIAQIAGQTNLLALNATIEAARAGEAGKGFAVVAGEVKNLAMQTAHATTEISDQIAAIKAATHDAVAAIGDIGVTIARVDDALAHIASVVADQMEATGEISRNAEYATEETAVVSRDIGDIHQGAVAVGQASTCVNDSAAGLIEAFARLKNGVDELVAGFRTDIGDEAAEPSAEEEDELF